MAHVEKGQEAEALYKKGLKCLSSSIFSLRFSPDWESAVPNFEHAASLFKQLGRHERAAEAYERASEACEHTGGSWHAAKNMEAAAEASKLLKSPKKTHAYFQRAAALHAISGKPALGADCLARGAKVLEEQEPQLALNMLDQALEIYEVQEKGINSMDVYRQAVSLCIKTAQLGKAANIQCRLAALCRSKSAHNAMSKSYLGVIVILLYANEGEKAWLQYQEFLAVDAFTSSEEAASAQALMNAYSSGEALQIQTTSKTDGCLRYLDNEVARLAVRLPAEGFHRAVQGIQRASGSAAGSRLRYSAAGPAGSSGPGAQPVESEEDEDVL